MEGSKYIVFQGASIKLTRNIEGFFEDEHGTVYAFAEELGSMDREVRCGVGRFSLSKDNPLNDACACHDYMYQSPVFQAFNTRSEADFILRKHLELIEEDTPSITPELFFFISRQLGGFFWENDETNN